ncbi:MAG: NAD(P)(+) transhydrogenase (Re/Si-specific) subunit alpha, partial [Actinomycetota bacterium]
MEDEGVLVGVPKETYPGETRVALVPSVLPALRKAGIHVVVEHGAGEAAGFPDEQYEEHGARLGSRDDVFDADVVAQVRTCGANPQAGRDDVERMHPDQVVIGFADPLLCSIGVRQAAEAKTITFAMDFVPRITRAQSMDALSSQATIQGYKAVLVAAERLPKMFPMLTTAAGTVPPAQVFIVGAGVAGLQAIATARRLGGVVQAYDVRPAAQEDIESLGARAV